ncbi:beta strand repeat-containing protein, partial [Enterococcus faecalis]
LLQLEFSEDTQLTAFYKEKLTPMARAVSVDQSIADTIPPADKTKVIVVPSPGGDGAAYKEYASTEAGFEEALFDLYQH